MAANFSFRELKGPKAAVIERIQSDPTAPAEAKAYLAWVVSTIPADGVVVDTHVFATNGDYCQHLHVKKLY
jgi:hypothetical protein